ncbi:MAG: zinc-dependent metalloprotease [Acidimicrobiales bacterium]
MSEPVDWELARRVAHRVARREEVSLAEHGYTLLPDFTEFTAQAEELVAETTGLRSTVGPARARVADRSQWVDANIASFQRLLRPLLDKMGDKMSDGFLAPVGRRVAAVEMGGLLGWMSTRVLGQYDLLVIEDENPEDQDLVYYVGPNVIALEKKFAFPTDEFRLWLALHEVTHRAQFTGVPWLRDHFLELVNRTLDAVDPDPQRFLDGLKRMMEIRKAGGDPLADGGVAALVASPEQRDVLDEIAGMMSLLEGHGDVTMDRAGADLIPSADRFARVLRNRRNSAKGLAKLFQRMIGIDAKIQQYAQGEAFIEAVETAGGTELLDRAWEGPEALPTIFEIRDPDQWIERMQPVVTPS